MRHYSLDPADPVSWLYLEDRRAFKLLGAFVRAGMGLGGVWEVLALLRILPRKVQGILYRAIARNHYQKSGRTDLCSLPDEQIQKRLVQ